MVRKTGEGVMNQVNRVCAGVLMTVLLALSAGGAFAAPNDWIDS